MDSEVKKWTSDVATLPYFERRLEIARGLNPKPIRFLYKYLSLVPEDTKSVERVRDILIESKLWMSAPEDFNDPFDMQANITLSASASEQRSYLNNVFKKQGFSYTKRETAIKKAMRHPKEFQENFKKSYRKNIQKIGVVCFSSDPRNILMWSHYAKYHTGICIQFERARDFPTLAGAVSVRYSAKYPQVIWPKDFIDTDILGEAVLTKHIGWKYEDEHRFLIRDRHY